MADISKITVDGVTYNVKDETARRVDDELSATSTNPVQNRAIYSALAGKLGADQLEGAVNDALAQAKESGEFDGADGQTGPAGPAGATPSFSIGTVETLEAGSNATASITGTDAAPVLNLGIPKGADGEGGSGGEKRVRRIATVTVTTETTSYTVNTDSNGNAFSLKDVYIIANTFFGSTGSYVQVKVNNVEVDRLYGAAGSPMNLEIERTGDIQKKTNRAKSTETKISFGDYYNGKKVATALAFWTVSVSTDATIEVYGVDA